MSGGWGLFSVISALHSTVPFPCQYVHSGTECLTREVRLLLRLLRKPKLITRGAQFALQMSNRRVRDAPLDRFPGAFLPVQQDEQYNAHDKRRDQSP